MLNGATLCFYLLGHVWFSEDWDPIRTEKSLPSIEVSLVGHNQLDGIVGGFYLGFWQMYNSFISGVVWCYRI